MKAPSRLLIVLHAATTASLVLLPVTLIAMAVQGAFGRAALLEEFPGVVQGAVLSDLQVVGAGLSGVMPVAAVLWILWRMRKLFALYRRGAALSVRAAREIHAIGIGLLALAVATFLAHTAQVLILSSGNPEGERMLAFAFGSGEVGFALAAGLLVVIGRSMSEAAATAEELRGFV